jgi:hypothetical protein
MSFFSVYGIITGCSCYIRYINLWNFLDHKKFKKFQKPVNFLNYIIFTVAVTFFAQLAILPVLITTFYKISIVSIFSNLLLIPLSFLIMVFVSVWFLITPFAMISSFLCLLISVSVKAFIKISYFFASFKYSVVYFSFPNDMTLIFSVMLILIILHIPLIDFKNIYSKVIISIVIAGFVISSGWSENKDERDIILKRYKLDGFITFRDNSVYVIDPVIDSDKIINSIFYTKHNNIDFILITGKSKFNSKTVDELQEVFDIKNIYKPLWICNTSKNDVCVFPYENYENFSVRFKDDYGYFNRYSHVSYCFNDKCY